MTHRPHVRLQGGFTLIVAVVFISVFLGFGLALSSLGYKQSVLASSAVDSQYAFYAAESGLECALHNDQQLFLSDPASHPFSYANMGKADGALIIDCVKAYSYSAANFQARCKGTAGCPNYHVTYWRIPVHFTDHVNRPVDGEVGCAYLTVYSPHTAIAGLKTYIYSEGYNVRCSDVGSTQLRISSRGLQASY